MESSESNFIRITESLIKDKKLGKHVQYKIKGNDSNGPFEIIRRYKEFFVLHNLLLISWPGCYVPSIPPKQITGNLFSNFIENRMKLLNDFLQKIMQVPFLYNSTEFQNFIRGQNDFCKVQSEFKEKSFVEIAENFTETFSENLILHSSEDKDKIIQNNLQGLTLALPVLEAFEQSCRIIVDNFHNFEVELNNLIGGINEINNFYSETYSFQFPEITQRGGFSNPYSVLLEWSKIQILDIQAMVEALSRRNLIEKMKQKITEKLKNEMELLENLKKGKKKLINFLSSKSKEEKITHQEKVITDIEIEIKAIDTICRINNERIINAELPQFKKENFEKFQAVLSTFVNATGEEFDQINTEFKPLYKIYMEIFQ